MSVNTTDKVDFSTTSRMIRRAIDERDMAELSRVLDAWRSPRCLSTWKACR
ncbi:hypothetical protein [Arthrobacter sp. JCM 19049]|uniref:hypothetical protein n=1 Tax=Arthrobacter sp. JCM 19049 TaxID=1460643 RepID=UPI0024372571|nr:hypothetical protein [Arthrobacter sp. JCM 19049]